MRIVLDISGADDVHVDTAGIQAMTNPSDAAAADGGAGPNVASADSIGSASGDVGPPPDWLLEAVGAAERAGSQTSLTPFADLHGTEASDGGAGPTAEPQPDGT